MPHALPRPPLARGAHPTPTSNPTPNPTPTPATHVPTPPYPCPEVGETANPEYWRELHGKFAAIHLEVQEKSKSINKSFGIFNAQTLRHCATNIAQDVAGCTSLIKS